MMTRLSASSAAGATRRLRTLSLLGGAALLLAATGSSQAAITPSNVDPWQHIVDCAVALFNDPAEHAQFCEPGPAPMDLRTNFIEKIDTPPPPPPSSSEECDGPCEVIIGN